MVKKPGSKKGDAKPLKRTLDPAFPTRLHDAMVSAGYTKSDGTEDAPRLAAEIGCTRAVIRKYLTKGQSKTIEAHMLFAIAARLQISAEYLLEGKRPIARARDLSPDEDLVLNLYKNLDESNRAEWIRFGNFRLSDQPAKAPTKSQPFPQSKTKAGAG